MKKTVFALALALVAGGSKVWAQEKKIDEKVQLSPQLKRQLAIKKALIILSKEGVLVTDENDSLIIRDSILEELRNSGVLTEGVAKEGTVCIGAGQ